MIAAAPWRIVPAPDDGWYALSATEGPAGASQIEVRFDANRGGARSAVLRFTSGDNVFPFTISQSAPATGFDAPDYYFYINFGTMPALYSGLHLLSHDKPAYVFYERSGTYDRQAFPQRAQVFGSDDPDQNASRPNLVRMRDFMKERIRAINAEDPTAVFGLYVDDIRCRLGYDWFVAQGIDSARVKVTMLSDGTATYQNFYDYFGREATARSNWDRYAAEVEALDWDHAGRYPETRTLPEFECYTWPYYLATRPGYRLMMQDKSLLETASEEVAAQVRDRMEVESVRPYEMLAALPAAAQQQFYRMAGFDYDRFAAMFDATGRKNLVVIGTSHDTAAGERRQADYVRRIAERCGSDYALFFKPHPADRSAADYETRFPGLKLLPGQMPFEIFVWSLLDRIDLIGGYSSTVFLTVPVEKVGFVFASGPDELVRPLNILFRDARVEWMQ